MARVLIVEDEDTNREMAALMCRTAGYEVAIAADGREALAMLAAGSYDLVLLDVLMPALDGLEVVRAMRADPRWAGLPVVGVTAMADAAQVAAMREAGMDDVITKPYRRQVLLATIERRLAGRPPSDA